MSVSILAQDLLFSLRPFLFVPVVTMAPKKTPSRPKISSPGASLKGHKHVPQGTAAVALKQQSALTDSKTSRRLSQSDEKIRLDNLSNLLKNRYGDWDDFYKYQQQIKLTDDIAPLTLKQRAEKEYESLPRGKRIPDKTLKIWDVAYAPPQSADKALAVKNDKDPKQQKVFLF